MSTILGGHGSGGSINAHRAKEFPALWAKLTDAEKEQVEKLAKWEASREAAGKQAVAETVADEKALETLAQARRLYIMAAVELQRASDLWEVDDMVLQAMSEIAIRRVPVRSFEDWIEQGKP